MEWQQGSIVLATAGRDAGMYFVVVAADEHFVWLANGKRRTLANPKRKNKKHVQQKPSTGNRYCKCSDVMDG